jgi:RimJ/RimL family protein N-acetyltransferase
MLRGQQVALRARYESDVPVLHQALYDDVATRVRADSRPWRPLAPTATASPYRPDSSFQDADCFSVVAASDDERLAGEAVVWGIDLHNRSAHLGLSLLPEYRGRGFGTEVTSLLCYYGFSIRGLHRLQVDTLADNQAMISAATRVGFTQEGVRRQAVWVDGHFMDEVVLGLLSDNWRPSSS